MIHLLSCFSGAPHRSLIALGLVASAALSACGPSSAPADAGLGAGGAVTSTGGDGNGAGGAATGGTATGGTATGGTATGTGGSTAAGGGGSTATGGDASGGAPAAGCSTATGGGNDFGAPQAYMDYCAECHGSDAKGTNLGREVEHSAPSLVDYFVRSGDTNEWGGTAGCQEDTTAANYATSGCDKWGDQKKMPANTTTEISDAELTSIKDWLLGLPMPTTGAALYADFCAGCHGPGGDIPSLTYYVKNKGIVLEATSVAEFVDTIKNGLTTQAPDRRDAYMPPQSTILGDAEIELIRTWMCTQAYTDATSAPTTPAWCP